MQYIPPPGSFHYAPPPFNPRPTISGGTIAGLVALALIVPIIGPLIAFITGLKRNSEQGSGWLIGCGAAVGAFQLLVLLPLLIAVPNFIAIKEKSKEAETKQNLHSIQLAVERFAADSGGTYPTTIDELQAGNYLQQPPQNPFTLRPMRNISPGDEPFAGEFSYEPVMKDGKAVGYALYAYGSDKAKNELSVVSNIKHVIIHLTSDSDQPQGERSPQ
jgi:type II secretory pathway pseudopilin PulG